VIVGASGSPAAYSEDAARSGRDQGDGATAIFLVLIFFAIRFLASQGADSSPSALSKPYTNVAYGFALKMPADFSAYPPDASLVRDETGAPTGEAILLRNTFVDRAALQYGPVIRSD
jgi:hypothetical protein